VILPPKFLTTQHRIVGGFAERMASRCGAPATAMSLNLSVAAASHIHIRCGSRRPSKEK
jgi:hypothetical protein